MSTVLPPGDDQRGGVADPHLSDELLGTGVRPRAPAGDLEAKRLTAPGRVVGAVDVGLGDGLHHAASRWNSAGSCSSSRMTLSGRAGGRSHRSVIRAPVATAPAPIAQAR